METSRFEALIDAILAIIITIIVMEIPLPEPPKQVEQKPVKKQESKGISFEKRSDKPQNGIVYLDNPKQFYGRRTNFENIRSMIFHHIKLNMCCLHTKHHKRINIINIDNI